jgi:hypothetical protein
VARAQKNEALTKQKKDGKLERKTLCSD